MSSKPKKVMSADQKKQLSVGRLHVLTDYHFQQRYSHAELSELAIRGGADTIQFRQKSGHVRHRLRSAKNTASVCSRTSTTLIIDDDIALALSVQASGVHLGADDFPVFEARQLLTPPRLIGATATTLEQALAAQDAGADYIGFGPVFRTQSKFNPTSVKGLTQLNRVCQSVSIPVIAIAGITVHRVESVLDSGAFGIAVMSAVSLAADPTSATGELREMIERFTS